MKTPKLSVVIPAFNEAERLKKTLPQITKFFRSKRYSKEIIFVDDGSSDQTASIISQSTRRSKNIRLITHQHNQGKGAAVKTGVLASKGEWVLFMDADLSTPLAELDRFWPYTQTHQIIIGSRKMSGAKIKKRQSFIRESLGKVFTFLTNTLATQNISDITCGFKLFQGDVARHLFSQSVLPDWSFDAEVLFLAQQSMYAIKEVPVSWENDPRTKVNLLKDGLNSLRGLFTIRFNHLLHRYKL